VDELLDAFLVLDADAVLERDEARDHEAALEVELLFEPDPLPALAELSGTVASRPMLASPLWPSERASLPPSRPASLPPVLVPKLRSSANSGSSDFARLGAVRVTSQKRVAESGSFLALGLWMCWDVGLEDAPDPAVARTAGAGTTTGLGGSRAAGGGGAGGADSSTAAGGAGAAR